MNLRTFNAALALLLLVAAGGWAQPLEMRAETTENAVHIYAGESLFTTYLVNEAQKYPYFYPVNGPRSGESVTTESTEPYPHHHSLFFGCDRVNGGNYWQQSLDRGQIVSQAINVVENSSQKIAFENKCIWQRPEALSPFEDKRRIEFSAPEEDIRLIDFEITLTALMPVRIEKSNHALFSARVVPELSVEQGGTLVNAEGLKGEEETWGKKSPWCDYFGERDGVVEGIAIMSHPQNRWYPEPWFTRNYGFFSPTPMQWLEDGHVDFEQGERLQLKYRVVVHQGDTQEASIAKWFEDWKQK